MRDPEWLIRISFLVGLFNGVVLFSALRPVWLRVRYGRNVAKLTEARDALDERLVQLRIEDGSRG